MEKKILLLLVCIICITNSFGASTKPLNLKGSFWYQALKNAVNLDNCDSIKPWYSSYAHVRLYSVDCTPCTTISFPTVLSNNEVIPTDRNEVVVFLLNKTKGDFLVAIVKTESNNHFVQEDWMYTFDFNGNKIDSLCLKRSYENEVGYISDLVSEIGKDFDINITRLVPIKNHIDKEGNVPSNFLCRREDLKYVLDTDGHVRLSQVRKYPQKYYSLNELKYSEDYSIHNGHEIILENN